MDVSLSVIDCKLSVLKMTRVYDLCQETWYTRVSMARPTRPGARKSTRQKPEILPAVFPMRINKYLAYKGISTRRGADSLIERGFVTINGVKAILGDKVVQADKVDVRPKGKQKEYVYLAYNKPKGVITHSPQHGEEDIRTALKSAGYPADVAPMGRLDKDSHGLLILTNDGRVTDRLLNPRGEHEKEYVVKTQNELRSNFKQQMESGVDIEGYKTKPCFVQIRGSKEFAITLTEGKKHQIRRMCVALHNDVKDLRRTRIMSIRLDSTPEGGFRAIEGSELAQFLRELGL